MPKAHALLSASSAHRWLACPPSALLEQQFPEEKSEYAAEGTAAHELAELCAKKDTGAIPPEIADKLIKAFQESSDYYSTEMLRCAEAYGSFVSSLLAKATLFCEDPLFLTETRLDFSKWVKDGFGTGDCIILADGMLDIVDFKYGKGVKVSAVNNAQMRLYALGAISAFDDFYEITDVRMTIFQPRIDSEPEQETISAKELLAWAKKVVVPAAKLAYAGKGDFNPSMETCRFCRARERCKARAEKNLSLFNDDAYDDPALLTLDELGEILAEADDLRSWLSDLESCALSAMLNGESVKGWKLVEGRSNRKLQDEEQVVKALADAGVDSAMLYERKLISLTQMEKDFGKAFVGETLGDLIVKPAGKPTIAPYDDRRPEYQPDKQIIEAFDE